MIYIIQHIEIERPGLIQEAILQKKKPFQIIKPYLGEKIPELNPSIEGLVSMGGPMGVYESEKYPYLMDEMRLIESCIKSDRGVLGICLGSQLIAEVLGSKAYKGKHKEIGWYDIELSQGARRHPYFQDLPHFLKCLLWHQDIFDCPRGAVDLASSKLTACQGFLYDKKVMGLLVHLETTTEILEGMVGEFYEEIMDFGISPSEIVMDMSKYSPEMHRFANLLFSRWLDGLG